MGRSVHDGFALKLGQLGDRERLRAGGVGDGHLWCAAESVGIAIPASQIPLFHLILLLYIVYIQASLSPIASNSLRIIDASA